MFIRCSRSSRATAFFLNLRRTPKSRRPPPADPAAARGRTRRSRLSRCVGSSDVVQSAFICVHFVIVVAVHVDVFIDNNYNIFARNFEDKKAMLKDLLKSKVLLVPGHKAELYCIAAEEARELCIPIVTLGIGSLSERVQHGQTGFIAKDTKEFAEYTLEIFSDKNLWKKLRNNLIKLRNSKKWDDVASNLLRQL